MDALVEVLISKSQQAVRQLKFIITVVNGAWQVPDADGGEGVVGFMDKGDT